MLVLGVPVVDTLWAIVRRTLAGQPMWRADRGHLHHRLLARGFSPRQTVFVIYLDFRHPGRRRRAVDAWRGC